MGLPRTCLRGLVKGLGGPKGKQSSAGRSKTEDRGPQGGHPWVTEQNGMSSQWTTSHPKVDDRRTPAWEATGQQQRGEQWEGAVGAQDQHPGKAGGTEGALTFWGREAVPTAGQQQSRPHPVPGPQVASGPGPLLAPGTRRGPDDPTGL